MSVVLDKIRLHAKAHPNSVVYATLKQVAGGFENVQMTWSELDENSNRLAGYLTSRLKSKTPLLVCGHKDPLMLVAFLACVRSGRAYVPVDASTPAGRIGAIAAAVEPELILNVEDMDGMPKSSAVLGSTEIRALCETAPRCDDSEQVSGEDIHYIIFTSGSTGLPKGVRITAKCLDNFLAWSQELAAGVTGKATGNRIFINQAPFSFDLSVFDLYTALYTGGTIQAIPTPLLGDMKALFAYLKSTWADIWVSTPSFADLLLADNAFDQDLLPNLRLFLFCGESLTGRTAQRLAAAFPKARITNTYGPTESTVAVTSVEVTPEMAAENAVLPLGAEKPGTRILIMDEEGEVLPDGKKGEIVIVGDTVSPGYWKNAAKNAEVFGTYDADGRHERLYHTHDAGYRKDGLLYYCGRMDKQVKLHGYRIELEDIERNILAISGIERVVVIPERMNGEVKDLVAHIVENAPVQSAIKERQRIRGELKKRIPEYMIPRKFVFKDSLPITQNGKIDRKALENGDQC